jgi:hypothetical protein
MLTGAAPCPVARAISPLTNTQRAPRMYILNQHLQSVMVQSSYYIHLAEAKIIISPLQLFCGQDNTTCLLTY